MSSSVNEVDGENLQPPQSKILATPMGMDATKVGEDLDFHLLSCSVNPDIFIFELKNVWTRLQR